MRKITLILVVIGMVLSLGSISGYAVSLQNGLGGPADFGVDYLDRNDDGSTGLIALGSVFASGLNFYGTTYTGAYFNNNGNITFGSALGTYTPYSLVGATGNPIIAAYFGDVDTRGGVVTPTPGGTSTGSNLLWYNLDTTNKVLTLSWDDVGYYGSHTDKLNAFQLALIDRSLGNNPGDFDIKFTYEALQWTTGDASGGSGGLGGVVSRAGWNSGNGTDYAELSQSGDQSAMLGLTGASNVGTPGVFLFEVRSGHVVPTNPIPEPGTMMLLGTGLVGLVGLRKKRS